MSSPIGPRPTSIKEDISIKTFKPKVKCNACAKYTIKDLIEYLEGGKTLRICNACLAKEFMRTQEDKVKRIKFSEVKK
jgi:Zn finger protein HypA/HybF involved in hydrogenase expression